MEKILAALILVSVFAGGATLRCYTCSRVVSVPDGIDVGDLECSDGDWNLTEANTDRIRDDELCIACVKVNTYLGADRYELTRTCVFDGIDYGRNQKINTCATTKLKAGDYFRCVCDGDLCNARTQCETTVGCYDPPAGNCPSCPDDPCGGSVSHRPVVALLLATVGTVVLGFVGY